MIIHRNSPLLILSSLNQISVITAGEGSGATAAELVLILYKGWNDVADWLSGLETILLNVQDSLAMN
jgi:hypothetical protein